MGKKRDAAEANLSATSSSYAYNDRAWAPIVLLGPILPALVASVTIVVGHVILLTDIIDSSDTFYCGYPLDQFLRLAIITSYVLLMVFAWTFLGVTTTFTFGGRTRTLLRPFQTLRGVVMAYILPFSMAFVVMCYGTWAVASGSLTCPDYNPALYAYDLFLVITYWLGMGASLLYVFSAWFNAPRGNVLKDKAMVVQEKIQEKAAEHENKIFAQGFQEHDPDNKGFLTLDEFEAFAEELGLSLTGKKLKLAFAEMDQSGEGRIYCDKFIVWYRENEKKEAEEEEEEEEEE